jgi:F0F1-type ATP synthase membrane subunit c/vacuolar-type H+-ATPase subunit K
MKGLDNMKNLFIKLGVIMLIAVIACIGGMCISNADEVQATEESSYVVTSEGESTTTTTSEETSNNQGIGMIAAALAIGLAAIGSGIAVAVVASSAVGAISENPSLLGKTVIFAGLAEGIAIYGLIIAIMILSKI